MHTIAQDSFFKKIKKILNVISEVLLWVCIIVCVSLIALKLFGIRLYVVSTGSMMPTIPVGSVCVVDTNVPIESISVDDVISFTVGADSAVTHRAVRIENGGIITKGDANNAEDTAAVTKDNYIGKTVLWIKNIGFVVKSMQTVHGRIVIGVIFLITLISFGIPESKTENDA